MTRQTSILTYGPNNHPTTAEEVNSLATDFVDPGVLGVVSNTGGLAPMAGGLAVGQQGTPAMSVLVQPGTVYILTTPTGQNPQVLRTIVNAAETVAILANASGSVRYDWLYIRHKPAQANEPNTAGTDVAEFVTSRSTSNIVDDGPGATNSELLAIITVANGAANIVDANITDRRTRTTLLTGIESSATTGWNSISTIPTVASGYNKGQREYDLTFPGVNLSTLLSAGMKLMLDRAVTPPTQCADFEASSSQYAVDSTVSGHVFTDDFAVEAWVKLESYNVSANQVIASRFNGTSGWQLYIDTAGRPLLIGYNGGSGNQSNINAYQSIPLNKWVHIAAQLDMSGFVNSPTVSYIMIDGTDVPALVSRGGTSPTALVQAGNLEVGSGNVSNYFDGKLADLRLWGGKRTQTQVRDNMNQQLVGNETDLIGYWKLNGNFNDSTANANNLTATNGAIATSVDNPMKSREYAYITQVTYSAPNTTVKVFTGTDHNIPNMVLSAPHYSTHKSPFGFPTARGKWRVEMSVRVQAQQSTATMGAWYNLLMQQLLVPTGEWMLGYKANIGSYRSGSTFATIFATLSTSNNSETNKEYTVFAEQEGPSSVTSMRVPAFIERPYLAGQPTVHYLNLKTDNGTHDQITTEGHLAPTIIFAECAYA